MPNYARTGGILTIISGAFCIIYVAMSGFYILMGQFMQTPIKGQDNIPPTFTLIFTMIGVVMGLFFALVGALAITGGVFAIKRKHWAVAVAGAIAGAFLFFPCGIAGTILVSLGRPEFSALEGLQQSPTIVQQESNNAK